MKITVKNLYSEGRVTYNKLLIIKNGNIEEIRDCNMEKYDYENLAPALVDIHINGGEEYHFTANPSAAALQDIEFSAQKNGVGFVLPALITSPPETIFEAIETVKKYRAENPASGIMGLHLEGPFISVKKRGAHLTKFIQTPDDQLLRKILLAGEGVIKMMTIAPENFSNNQIKSISEAGVKVSLGHSDCTYQRAQEVFDLGVNLVTHLFNAMSAFTHRAPGLVGAALQNPEVYAPIIPDNVHVDFAAVQLALKLKGDKLFFISDALFQNGKKKSFLWEEFDVKLKNGNYINSDGNLAGATISMADCVKNGTGTLGLSLEKALEKSTSVPAEVLGHLSGKIEKGYPAKFIEFQEDMKNLNFLNFQ